MDQNTKIMIQTIQAIRIYLINPAVPGGRKVTKICPTVFLSSSCNKNHRIDVSNIYNYDLNYDFLWVNYDLNRNARLKHIIVID